ncbi:CbiX/SirB N-terminal domain-containing protein [Candidatus Zinderia endosymbiont of Aphrophora alni]|uniref:CbiX/SirB N-terminal domain-containing protein n=1 Tax=Candidatus Zinderia endosymbiont of Aphrophora alni TaxID=3077951 RepID=UPI0030CC2451
MINNNLKKSLILLSHGSKNKNWIKIFKKIKKIIKLNINTINIYLAFLTKTKPNIYTVIKNNIKLKINKIIIIPIFLSNGLHIKKDLPKIIKKIKKKYSLNIKICDIITKDKKILLAIAKYCIKEYIKN